MTPRVLIMLDQVTRDGLSTLLVSHYLERKGVKVLLCNQTTLKASFERHRPQALLVSWMVSPFLEAFLRGIRHRTQIVLIDQEGGRVGEAAFKRLYQRDNRLKMRMAESAAKVIAWGGSQRQWLMDLGIRDERIGVTGCPRLDPFLVKEKLRPLRPRYVGVTLRGDALSSDPQNTMRKIFAYLDVHPKDGIRTSYPPWAQYEDWVWESVALTRHFFKAMVEVSRRGRAPIVARPGPWEAPGIYGFLSRRIPRVFVEGGMLQHEYVLNALVTIDAASALGLESLIAGTPVVSIVSLVPRIEEHVGGKDGARLNSPYRHFFWQPRSIPELADLVLEAERGRLPVTPAPGEMAQYLKDCHDWPGEKPASFRIGELILGLLGQGQAPLPEEGLEEELPERLKRLFYRQVPGSDYIPQAKLLWQCLFAHDRAHLRRYHYLPWFYPHHAAVREIFVALWDKYEAGVKLSQKRETPAPGTPLALAKK